MLIDNAADYVHAVFRHACHRFSQVRSARTIATSKDQRGTGPSGQDLCVRRLCCSWCIEDNDVVQLGEAIKYNVEHWAQEKLLRIWWHDSRGNNVESQRRVDVANQIPSYGAPGEQ